MTPNEAGMYVYRAMKSPNTEIEVVVGISVTYRTDECFFITGDGHDYSTTDIDEAISALMLCMMLRNNHMPLNEDTGRVVLHFIRSILE